MTAREMFRVTPVPENRDRKVSFSPDIDESYRHQVVDKIQGLMKEVEVSQGFPTTTNFPTTTSNMPLISFVTKNVPREFT